MTGNVFQNDGIGLCISTTPLTSLYANATALFLRSTDGNIYNGSVFEGALNGLQGQVIGISYDDDNGLVWVRSEDTANVWHGTAVGADPATGTHGFPSPFGGNPVFLFMGGDGGTTDIATINNVFTYTAPAGFEQGMTTNGS